ncbi:MAG TPA: ABC transporter ATP-binding protein [Mesorhizobium sp.]|jgi:spermidine/putrescine ABC transporter ATP-binding subunit|nr:ABC transporter ATP-binding protein [Mesorhizobium sp.]
MLDMRRDKPAGEPMISIRRLSRSYGAVRALDDVSIDIAAGEFFSLLGPSGCGKTTLLRMLAGFDRPSGGEIYIDRQPISGVPPHKRPVKMVFQNYAIFPHLDVRENILYGLRRKGLSREEADDVVRGALELVKLPGLGARRPDQLSGGQRQRVALARALVCKPKVLLLDEPLGALDKKLREEMQLELRQLQQQVGITFVFVTHDQEEALAMSDRVAVMSQGRTLQIDTPVGLYETPNCRAVAAFIGTMNLMEGRCAQLVGGAAELQVGGLTLQAAGAPAGLRRGDPVSVGIRPEKIRLSQSQPSATNVLPGFARAQSYLGDRSHILVEVDRLGIIVASRQNSEQRPASPEIGERLWVELPPHCIHVFAAAADAAGSGMDHIAKGRNQDELEAAHDRPA